MKYVVNVQILSVIEESNGVVDLPTVWIQLVVAEHQLSSEYSMLDELEITYFCFDKDAVEAEIGDE